MFANFQDVGFETRARMRRIDREAMRELMRSENTGPVWIRISEWEGALDHLAPERPAGAGQIFRRTNRRVWRDKGRVQA